MRWDTNVSCLTAQALVNELTNARSGAPQMLSYDLRHRVNFVMTSLKLWNKGFFTRYDYLKDSDWDIETYPHILDLFKSTQPAFDDFLAKIEANTDLLLRSREDPNGPNWRSNFISPLDGASIHTFVGAYRPPRIIEIGSGNSTHFMARAIADLDLPTRILCIDPMPRVHVETLPVEIQRRVLDRSDVPQFAALSPGDLVFIDSSHIVQQGFDVDILFNRIFPVLKSGVLVHVHDIFLPFGYPSAWKVHRLNEQLALIGWITSGYFGILFASHYVWRTERERLKALCSQLDLASPQNGGSLWMVKR
jgi:predicted O-methyltransferase YrrM